MVGICQVCKRLAWGNHRCPPAWEVEVVGDEESRSKIYADDAKTAAEIFADEWDIANWDGEVSSKLMVHVRPASDGDWRTFTVRGELIPQYHAEEKKECSQGMK